jgi:hypothetical protein
LVIDTEFDFISGGSLARRSLKYERLETEQAHSSHGYSPSGGRDAVARRPRTAQRAVPTIVRSPIVWLNLVCLDAPLVSVAWLWLFARTFDAAVDPINCAALFLTAWLIYLADRLADSYSLQNGGPRSLRHEFCLNHRAIWIAAMAAIAIVDAYLIWRRVGSEAFLGGSIIGTLAVVYLVLNYSLGRAWLFLPLKELAIGFLFASGTLVALFSLFHQSTGPFAFSGIAFALLCTLNCISIAFWERELDETQGKVSFATRFRGLARHLGKISLALALASGVMAVVYRQASPILGCVSLSSLLLALLDALREKIGRDQRTALADLVLLTPVIALLFVNA